MKQKTLKIEGIPQSVINKALQEAFEEHLPNRIQSWAYKIIKEQSSEIKNLLKIELKKKMPAAIKKLASEAVSKIDIYLND